MQGRQRAIHRRSLAPGESHTSLAWVEKRQAPSQRGARPPSPPTELKLWWTQNPKSRYNLTLTWLTMKRLSSCWKKKTISKINQSRRCPWLLSRDGRKWSGRWRRKKRITVITLSEEGHSFRVSRKWRPLTEMHIKGSPMSQNSRSGRPAGARRASSPHLEGQYLARKLIKISSSKSRVI